MTAAKGGECLCDAQSNRIAANLELNIEKVCVSTQAKHSSFIAPLFIETIYFPPCCTLFFEVEG